MSSIFYKFSTAKDALKILESGKLWSADPLDFNDPFEILPAFDDERKDTAVKSRDRSSRIDNTVPQGTLSLEIDAEFPGEISLHDQCHEIFFQYVSQYYRVICFNRQPENVLMWSHYGVSHKGIAIGFDLAKGGFPRGTYPGGLQVDYVSDRTNLKLPVHFYYFEALREWESQDLPPDLVRHGKLVVPRTSLHQQIDDAIPEILRHKFESWGYESEFRFLYDLRSANRAGLTRESAQKNGATIEKDVAKFSDDAVSEIILGCFCPPREAEALFKLICAKRFLNARLYITKLHEYDFKVEFREVSPNEMVNCYTLSKPGTWRGRPR